MHVVIHGVARGLGRGLEQGTYVHVKAHVRISGSDYLGAAVVTILPHLGDHYAGAAALVLFEFIGHLPYALYRGGIGRFLGIYAGNGAYNGLMAAADLFYCHRYLSQACARSGGFNGQLKQIAFARLNGLGDRVKALLNLFIVAIGAQLIQPCYLRLAHGGVVNFKNVYCILVFKLHIVQADYILAAGVYAGLTARGGFFYSHLRQAGFYCLGHAAQLFNFLYMAPCTLYQLIGQGFNII